MALIFDHVIILKNKNVKPNPLFYILYFFGPKKKNLLSSICANLVYVTFLKKKIFHQNGEKDVISGLGYNTYARDYYGKGRGLHIICSG